MPRKAIDEPIWNVYCEDCNGRAIKIFNVFHSHTFLEQCKKEYKRHRKPEQIEELEKEIKGWARYCFWSKCEYEIILSSWPEKTDFKEEKIDVYDQLLLNWDAFFKYFVEHKAFFLRR